MRATADDLLFLGTYGHVVAIRKKSGRKLWAQSLPGTGYSIVSLLFEDGLLFAGSKGHVFALDAMSGEILWHNRLAGFGHGHMVLATTRRATDSTPLNAQLDRDAASRSSSTRPR